MATYKSEFPGEKIDEAVRRVLNGEAGGSVTADSIKTALGYTPADATKVEALEKEVENGISDEDKHAIALLVRSMIEDDSVQVVVDENKTITLTCEEDGVYTIKYYNKDGSTTTISTLTVSSGSGSGSGGTEEPEEPDTPDEPDTPVVTPTGNLFVASTCILNQRINSSGAIVDQDQAFTTDYINIGNCMANGGTNQLHYRGFLMYKASVNEEGGTMLPGMGNVVRAVTYYNTNNEKIGQTSVYATDFVGDANGDGVITLDATMTAATKIRVSGAIGSADLTSTSQLANCIITLNELITG